MEQKRHASSQTRYFRKDYKPATFAANQKKTSRRQNKTTHSLKKVATNAGRSVGKAVQATKKATTKVANSAKKLTKAKSETTRTNTSEMSVSPARFAQAHSATSSRVNAKTSRKARREPMTWREIMLLSQVGVSMIAILFTFAFCAINDPVKRSQSELEKLAKSYYVEHLYPATLGKYLYQPEVVLAEYAESGLPSVRLRQLLLFDNGKFSNSAKVFSNNYYQCDVNETRIDYYPVEPYGPRDVTISFSKVCEKLGAL